MGCASIKLISVIGSLVNVSHLQLFDSNALISLVRWSRWGSLPGQKLTFRRWFTLLETLSYWPAPRILAPSAKQRFQNYPLIVWYAGCKLLGIMYCHIDIKNLNLTPAVLAFSENWFFLHILPGPFTISSQSHHSTRLKLIMMRFQW